MIPHSRPLIGAQEIQAVQAVLRSGMLLGGNEAFRLKEYLSRLSMGNPAALFSSGRKAILASLVALDLPRGSGVVVQTYVCDAVVWSIYAAGLQPVFCDIGDGWTVRPDDVSAVISERCSAILLAPPYGLFQSALPFRKFKLPIIHDLSQASALVLSLKDRVTFGDIVTLSFHPTKYVCAAGGGAALDFTGEYAAALKKFSEEDFGAAPFSELQAAIGLAQLQRLDAFKEKRLKIFDLYIAASPHDASRMLMRELDVEPGCMFRFPLTIGFDAKELFPAFAERGVTVRHGVDQLAHRSYGRDDDLFPNAISALRRTISIPFYPHLSSDEMDMVARSMELLS